MPAVSEKQRVAAAIAKHAPGKLYARNRGLLKMSQEQLGDFASKPTMRLRDLAPKRRKNA